MFSKTLFKRLKPTLRLLDYESYLFFDEIFTLYETDAIRNGLFEDDESRNKVITSFNIYLRDEESYNKLKQAVKSIYVTFINDDIFNSEIKGKFDNILLSNLCTITSVENLKELITKLDINNLNDGGSILLGYLWNIDFTSTQFIKGWKEIYNLPKTKEILGKYITEAHDIKSAHDVIWDKNYKDDLALIYKKTPFK